MSEQAFTMESGMASATAALAAGLSGNPAPVTPPTPTPAEPAAQPTPGPVAAAPEPPAAAAPAPSAPSATPAPPAAEVKDPAARRYLEMRGGNVEAALAKALNDNNRLAQIAREHPELFQPGGPADPNRQTTPPTQLFEDPPPVTPTLPTIQVDEGAIRAVVDQAVFQDPEATGLVRTFMANKQQLGAMSQERGQLEQRSAYINQLLTDTTLLSPDDLRRGEFQNELARIEQKVGLIEGREARLSMNQERLADMFDRRKALISDYHTSQARQQAEEEATTAYQRDVEQAEYRKTLVEWPSALERCIKENNIPPEQVDDFKEDARRAFMAAMADPNNVISDMYAFLSPVAKQLTDRLDRYHRVRAGQYATSAQQRSLTPSPATGPGTPAPPNAPPVSPEDAMMQATRAFRQRIRA